MNKIIVGAQTGTPTDSNKISYTINLTKKEGKKLGLHTLEEFEWISGPGRSAGAWSTLNSSTAILLAKHFGQTAIKDVVTRETIITLTPLA